MVGEVVADIEAFDFAVLGELLEEILIELLEVVLDLARVDGVAVGVDAGGYHVGALVHVGEENGGTYAGLCVEARAAIPVPTGADLEVERAIDPVLLRSEYRCQVLRHCRNHTVRYCFSSRCWCLGFLVMGRSKKMEQKGSF